MVIFFHIKDETILTSIGGVQIPLELSLTRNSGILVGFTEHVFHTPIDSRFEKQNQFAA